MQKQTERTLAIIKPDALRQNNVGRILSLIEESTLTIIAMKLLHLSEDDARTFYNVHEGKPFYEPLVTFMTSGPCIPMVLEGENALVLWRNLMGPTDPESAPEGTIRKLYGSTVRYNAVHGSDSRENADSEISFFFSGIELRDPTPSTRKGN